MKKFLTINNLLKLIATVVGAAGVIVAAPVAAMPVALVAFATKVLTYGTVAGVIAAKVLPGNGKNAPDAVKDAPTP